jgi:hypothetical protein
LSQKHEAEVNELKGSIGDFMADIQEVLEMLVQGSERLSQYSPGLKDVKIENIGSPDTLKKMIIPLI